MVAVLAAVPPARALEIVSKSDARIKARVEAALEADETLSGSRIFVRSVNDGVVQLAGEANTPTDDRRAMGDAARVPGVRRITSEIESPNRPADEETARGGESAESGAARLTGTVPTEQQRLSAGLAARSVMGLRSVHEDLRVSRRPWSSTPERDPLGGEEGGLDSPVVLEPSRTL